MTRPTIRGWFPLASMFLIALVSSPTAARGQFDRFDFFESRIRPVLVEHCYPCHNSVDDAGGDLAVDWRDAIRTETGEGTAVVPFQPADSLLLRVIRHEIPGLEMPDGSAKLSDEVIADFEKWIADGAQDPRMHAPTREQFEAATSWEETFQRRLQWWCFQPVVEYQPPDTSDDKHPIDAFIRDAMMESGLQPSARADRRTLIRRLSFALKGLPPTLEEIREFEDCDDPDAFEQLVDRYLASTQFGERWARHWMDLVRYADSHGSEGDPAIPHSYRYRDYLIRAFNQDVPYDQLVREHVAGDLLPEPRINEELGIDESAIGTAHLRLVFHGFAPTDALDEKVRFTDDQINVFSKAFQGLTVSCARCHDHKFDAISQADYYALFGVFGSCRPAMQDVNTAELQNLHVDRLKTIKSDLRNQLADFWLDNLAESMSFLRTSRLSDAEEGTPRFSALRPWHRINEQLDAGIEFEAVLEELLDEYRDQNTASREGEDTRQWNFDRPADVDQWYMYGNGMENSEPPGAGNFSLSFEGDRVLKSIYPAALVTDGISTKHRGVATSPRVQLDGEYRVWLNVVGGGSPSVRYVVQNYPRDGTVYPINNINRDDWYWHQYDMTYWDGDQVHFELTTSRDAPLRVGNDPRSWFGIREVLIRPKGAPEPQADEFEYVDSLYREFLRDQPASPDDITAAYASAIRSVVTQWKNDDATDADALFLDACLRSGLIANDFNALPDSARRLVEEYRRLEADIPEPTRVPGVAEADAYDHPLYERGDHRKPLAPVDRRYLEAINPTAFGVAQSGRLQLADALFEETNPLTSRVIVNRIWHYLFGAGIVTTPDNFGLLGTQPTHPELLDYLAIRMQKNGWSIKDTIRFIVLSQTWQQESTPSELAARLDPENRLLSHFSLRRLEAEAIRDSLLAASGQLDDRMFGPGDGANSNSRRRSIYIRIRRNQPDAFLSAFDLPEPFATTGRRMETNVPAQSLTLMNDEFVMQLASELGQSVRLNESLAADSEKLEELFGQIMGRKPSAEEQAWLIDFFDDSTSQLVHQRELRRELQNSISSLESAVAAIMDPAKQRILDRHEQAQDGRPEISIAPAANWDFTASLQEQINGIGAQLNGGGRQTPRGLVLNGSGFVATEPFDFDLQARTLIVRARLSTLDQPGAGLMTIQGVDGDVFDSIVFGEQSPRQWLAGSNHFQRTEPFNGQQDDEAAAAPVQFAIVYDEDGTIRGYRNGVAYGEPYRKSPAIAFRAGEYQILFGMRHGTAVNRARMFKGTILDAMLYDRALSAEEIEAISSGRPIVTRQNILDSLSEVESDTLLGYEKVLGNLNESVARLGEPQSTDEAWTQVAHALFNLKEFIYVR